jgi:AcrR family transcriptional regulator
MDSNAKTSSEYMPIRELSERAGVPHTTIHYYSREGLLPPPFKTGRTMALYSNEHLECLRLIRKLKEERNLPIAAIRHEVQKQLKKGHISADEISDENGLPPEELRKGRKQRRLIIEAAISLFSGNGYNQTHVSHITDTLHISKGTFYLYFRNKNDLLVALFEHIVDELTTVEDIIADEPNIDNRMLKRGAAYVQFYKKYYKILNIIRSEAINSEVGSQLRLESIYRKIIGPLSQDIKKGQEEGIYQKTKMDTDLMSYMTLGALEFLCYRLLIEKKYSIKRTIDELIRADMIWPRPLELPPPKK